MVVEVELQQLQIVWTNLATKKEIIPQPAVDVFYPTAAAERHRSQGHQRLLQTVKLATQSATQRFSSRTVLRRSGVQAFQIPNPPRRFRQDVEFRGQARQLLVQPLDVGQQLLAMVFQQLPHRCDAMSALRFPLVKFVDQPIQQCQPRG